MAIAYDAARTGSPIEALTLINHQVNSTMLGQDFAVEAALWSLAGHARGHGVGLAAKSV